MAEIGAKDAEKVDVLKLSEQQVEMNLKGQDGNDDSKVYKAVADDEDAQLDDLMATSADGTSIDDPLVSISEPRKDLNAKLLSKNEVEHNLGEELRDNEEMEEFANTFEGKDNGLDYKFAVIGEADHNNEEESPGENSEVAAEDLPYPTYSETTLEKPRMFSEESKDVGLLFEGTFIKNSDEILKNLDKFPDAEVVTQLEDKVGADGANALKAMVNDENKLLVDQKVTGADATIYEDFTAPLSLSRRDLNANIVKKEVEHDSDGTSEDFIGRSSDVSNVSNLEIENNKDFEYPARSPTHKCNSCTQPP